MMSISTVEARTNHNPTSQQEATLLLVAKFAGTLHMKI